MSARRLKTFVTVRDSKFRPHRFGPGDDLPQWAIDGITLRSAWADNADDAAPAAPSAPTPTPAPTPPADAHDGGEVIDDEPVKAVEPQSAPDVEAPAPKRRGRPPKAR